MPYKLVCSLVFLIFAICLTEPIQVESIATLSNWLRFILFARVLVDMYIFVFVALCVCAPCCMSNMMVRFQRSGPLGWHADANRKPFKLALHTYMFTYIVIPMQLHIHIYTNTVSSSFIGIISCLLRFLHFLFSPCGSYGNQNRTASYLCWRLNSCFALVCPARRHLLSDCQLVS